MTESSQPPSQPDNTAAYALTKVILDQTEQGILLERMANFFGNDATEEGQAIREAFLEASRALLGNVQE